MGDINFTIAKDVDLNKVVNLDIDKDVDVNVNNDDILATAEADAEAFGERALAETDAFTYVSQRGGGREEFESPGQVDGVGNASIDLTDDADGDGVVSSGDTITITYEDVDDINGILHWTELSSPPPETPDAILPQEGVFTVSDKVLLIGEEILEGEFEATLVGDHTIDFGERTLSSYELNGGPHNFDITVPDGSQYLVEVSATGNLEVEYDIRPDQNPDPVLINFGPENADVTTELYTQEAAQIGELGEWNFDVGGTLTGARTMGTGEAFSYAESTAALDLNGDDNVVPLPPETEL